MLEMLKNKVMIVRGIRKCTYRQALVIISEAECCEFVEDYLENMLDYHDRVKFANWLNFVE